MTLQTSGSISILDIANEFGGGAPHSLSEYYRGGARVPANYTYTIYEPGPGASNYTWSFPPSTSTGVAVFDLRGANLSYEWRGIATWNGTTIADETGDYPISGLTSLTVGIWTYYRETTVYLSDPDGVLPDNDPPGTWPVEFYRIRRERDVTVAVNTGVPTSGTISLGDFYGAEDV